MIKEKKIVKRAIGVCFILALSMLASAQSAGGKYVAICCNSYSDYQRGFAQYEFPTLPPGSVEMVGQDGFTCGDILKMMPNIVPAQATHVELYDTTNDAAAGTPTADLMSCIVQTIQELVQRNRQVKIVVALTAPWTSNNCSGDRRDLIDDYNSAFTGSNMGRRTGYEEYPGLAAMFPSNVTVVDVWTPNLGVQQDRYAASFDMAGFCGVHPGPSEQWTWSWQHFTAPMTQAVMQ